MADELNAEALADYRTCICRAIRSLDASSFETPPKIVFLDTLEEQVRILVENPRDFPHAEEIRKIHLVFLERIAFH